MSKIFCRLAPALLVLIFSCVAFGDDFKSLTIPAAGSETILVHNGQFMIIRNFTQESGSDRGFVSATRPPTSTDPADTTVVLTAAILDTSTATPEIINNVVIAGPANVVFQCGSTGGNCFVSFKKDSN